MMNREALLTLARETAQGAHCPYSHFRVGAALIAGGQVFVGVNIEVSSYGLTLCAERAALAAAITAQAGPITHIAVACIDVEENAPLHQRMPCGACRQWLADLAPEVLLSINGYAHDLSIADILPYAFQL